MSGEAWPSQEKLFAAEIVTSSAPAGMRCAGVLKLNPHDVVDGLARSSGKVLLANHSEAATPGQEFSYDPDPHQKSETVLLVERTLSARPQAHTPAAASLSASSTSCQKVGRRLRGLSGGPLGHVCW